MYGDDLPVNDPRRHNSNVLTTQISLAVGLGLPALVAFCILRKSWPSLYAVRTTRRKGLPHLPASLFGWIPALYRITDEQVLEHAGLDAYVFLGFFRMSLQLLATCAFFAITVIGPIRLYFTGDYDQGDDDGAFKQLGGHDDPTEPEVYQAYLWTYVFFTYFFTSIALYFLQRQTRQVVEIRQSYLGRQDSITDRTIRISGIPLNLRSEEALKNHIESLHIGTVRSVTICKQWGVLDKLSQKRKSVLNTLEEYWCNYLGEDLTLFQHRQAEPAVDTIVLRDNDVLLDTDDEEESDTDDSSSLLRAPADTSTRDAILNCENRRPTIKLGGCGLWGSPVDAIDYYTAKLNRIDERIKQLRNLDFEATSTAFVTMDSVASAQMAAQAVLDPHPRQLLVSLAPAPHDVIWKNIYQSYDARVMRTYAITILIVIISVALVFPVSYIAAFLNIKTISKFWPAMGRFLKTYPVMLTFVTGVLPTLLFTIMNLSVPYIFILLSSIQGFVSYGEAELSVVSKNFFYTFFNLFLVFTVAGTASNYWALLKDTTQIAYQLATSLRNLSLFYVDLIILQGVGLFPIRLLEFGSVLRFSFFKMSKLTPRQYRNLYQPATFNLGVNLPQPILILIITLLYSVMSSKICTAGTIYFFLGYFVYKYQLMYAMVHPPHSTGQSWPLIFRRVCLGVVVFHLTMAGILALQKAYALATLLAPLPLITVIFWFLFEKYYLPLSYYIALRAIDNEQTVGLVDSEDGDTGALPRQWGNITNNILRRQEERRLRGRSRSITLDEDRERHSVYNNPNLNTPLDGPWLKIQGDEVIYANSDGTLSKVRPRFEEWEEF